MSESEVFDVIVIGAGPAGIACAYTLAKEGKEVLVIERADTPGGKNVTGGRLYTYALEMVEEGLSAKAAQDAALERKVTHEQIMIMSDNRAITVDYYDPAYNDKEKIPQSYTVLRAPFDEWFAGQAEEVGVMVACGVRVDELIEEDGKIVGVVAGEDEMYAKVIVAADGVKSFIARKAGLIDDIHAHSVGVGVKEVIELPEETIKARFNLEEGEGVARMILGCTEGIRGGGFLYTNTDSISLGCVFMPEEVGNQTKNVHEIFQELKMHPAILPLIEGGETIEYGAHLVGEEGYRGIPKKLYKEGFLMVGDTAGFVINTGYSIRGIDLAILSGIAAARAILSEEDTAQIGPRYMTELKNINLMPTMKAVEKYADLLEIPRIYDTYTKVGNDVFRQLFTVNGEVPKSIRKEVFRILKDNKLSLWQLIKDGIRGGRST